MPPQTKATPEQVAAELEQRGAVLLNQAQQQPKVEELTFLDLCGLAFQRAHAYLSAAEHAWSKREFALAKTHLEDAIERFNRGRLMELDAFMVPDTESPQFLNAVNQAKEGDPS